MNPNLILIGMAGCGKSTIGVVAAKLLGYDFVDSDLVLQKQEGRLLREIIADFGVDYFKDAEERALCSLDIDSAVIATGGSAVYSERAMNRLRENGVCVWLRLPFDEIEKRVGDAAARGIVMEAGKTLRDVYDEREPLYRKYADVCVDCTDDVARNAAIVVERFLHSRKNQSL